jgi:hypothetical protein
MGATSVTGVGQGSANKVGPAIKNITINDPHIIMSGNCDTSVDIGSGNWQVLVEFPELPLGPEHYSVFVIQSDHGNSDERNQYPAHIEKLDANGNNEDDGFETGLGGFILHTGDSNTRTFMYMVVKNGMNVRS